MSPAGNPPNVDIEPAKPQMTPGITPRRESI